MTQTRNFPAALERVPQLQAANPGYRYVLFHWLFITITRRSVQLAISTACLTFTALQVASDILCTRRSSLFFLIAVGQSRVREVALGEITSGS